MAAGVVNHMIIAGANTGIQLTLGTVNTATNTAQTVSFPTPQGTFNPKGTVITIANLATETIELKLSQDNGTSYSAAYTPLVYSTMLQNSTAALANGTYYIPPEHTFDKLKFTKSASTDRVFIAAASVLMPNL